MNKFADWGIGIGVTIIIIVALCGVSWIAICGIIKLITICFGWTFKWSIATGIWLIICIMKYIFSHSTGTNKRMGD